MSWDKHHDRRMEDLRVLGPIATRIIQKDSSELKSLREENKKLREECEYLKTRLASSGVRAFSNGVACCGVFFGFVLVSAISCYLFTKGYFR